MMRNNDYLDYAMGELPEPNRKPANGTTHCADALTFGEWLKQDGHKSENLWNTVRCLDEQLQAMRQRQDRQAGWIVVLLLAVLMLAVVVL